MELNKSEEESSASERQTDSDVCSYVSMKSDRSIGNPPSFSVERGEPSCVSMKSDRSIGNPPNFSGEAVSSELNRKITTKKALHAHALTERTGNKLQDSYQPLDDILHRFSETHKTSMKNKYENLFEGIIKTQENKTRLHKIYTQLYIIEGDSARVNEEHEVLEMEILPRKYLHDTPINYLDIFKPLQGPKRETEEQNVGAQSLRPEVQQERKVEEESNIPKIRSVMTKGIAGIGKTVSVQKFILDWAEGIANQDVDFMFLLPFRELNLIKDDQYSLYGLLCAFHPELKDLEPNTYETCKVVFIFDGLDESRIKEINFSDCTRVSDITMVSSVGVLMTNLIKGDLLPSALTWITSRPAAANQIPSQYISRMTEIQGFNDPQKEEYFRKRISDQEEAQKIISHIKSAKTLHIMCHIPVFCWISATVLQQMIKQCDTEIPKTLTEMYLHFLLTQISMKNVKYEEEHERDPKELLESNRPMLLKLAELAYNQLMKGNVMFYEEDLQQCDIDITNASVYSGVFTELFREECIVGQRKVFCFVHLTFQEFLAAVYVVHCYESKNMGVLQFFGPFRARKESDRIPLDEVLMGAVSKALKFENGRLDLFLRFLLGISLETNQTLLQGLLTHKQRSTQRTTEFIKKLIKGDENERLYIITDRSLCTERSSSLLFCLSEMNDQSLYTELQEYLKSEHCPYRKLSPGQCSALAYMLRMSEVIVEELHPKQYNTSAEGYRRFIFAVPACRKALLSGCNLTTDSCEKLSLALQSSDSCLKHLDVSYNDLGNSGVEQLSLGLKSSYCNLVMLRLTCCNLTKDSCKALSSALQSVNSCMKELVLSNNDLQDSGVMLLSAGLESPCCKLEILRLAFCSLGGKSCDILASALQSEKHCLKELDLSNNDLYDSGVKLLCAGLESPHCKLETLRLSGCMVTSEGCSLASALKLNPSHLRELDLTYNPLEQSLVEMLGHLVGKPNSKLENIEVEHGDQIRMKPGLKKYICNLTLDPNTVNRNLRLSEENKKVSYVNNLQWYPDHPDRFENCSQVLCKEPLAGRCYWEAECEGDVEVAVAYSGNGRREEAQYCIFGLNNQSWSLVVHSNGSFIRHNMDEIEIPAVPSSRVGLYLDRPAGTLSFYNISPDTHTLSHFYTLHTRFTEPLYAGFRLSDNSSVSVAEIE